MKKIIFAAITAVVFSGAMGIASAYSYDGHAAKKAVSASCACTACSCDECSCTDCADCNCDTGCCDGGSDCSKK